MSSKNESEIMAASTQKIKQESFRMKHALDNGNVLDALKHASDMVSELRTGLLGPKNYYELYVTVFEHLRFLEFYLYDETTKSKRRVKEIYELVQYAGNILPRLYLLVTVGSVYIKSKEASAKDVLQDLKEMLKGVQHPTRGLFLRSYLSEMTKDKLPDEGSDYAGDKGGNIDDCIAFITENFVEMNKLWVRMQHQGGIRERAKREKERKELGPLIGKMLSRLSNLDGMTSSLYGEKVLPTVVDQIINCKDAIAQEYLMECVIQVFADEFHLLTLNRVLEAVEGLVDGVDVKSVLVSFIDRLVSYVQSDEAKESQVLNSAPDMFALFYDSITRITNARTDMPPEHVLALYTSLMDLTIQVYPENLENVDKIFASAAPVLGQRDEKSLRNARVVKGLVNLLHSPLQNYRNILTVLRLSNYPKLFAFLSLQNRRAVCLDVVRSVIRDGVPIATPEETEAFLFLVSPLIVDPKDEPEPEMDEEDEREFAADQNLVGSVVHMMRNSDGLVALQQLSIVRKFFGMGGTKRITYTIPTMLCRSFAVALQIFGAQTAEQWKETGPRVFKFVLSTCKTYNEHVDNPNLAFRLFLQAAQCASACGLEEIAYEFVSQAFTVYEDAIPDSHDQVRAMTLGIATLHSILDTFKDEDNEDSIVTKAVQHSKRVLKKGDQVLLIAGVSHLFWRNKKEPERVTECLRRSLKLATNLTEGGPELLIHILAKYIYYLEVGNSEVSPETLNSLIELVGSKVNAQDDQSVTKYYKDIVQYVSDKRATDEAKWGTA